MKTPKQEKITAQAACAFVFHNGEAHQVIIPSSELIGLLSDWFKANGKGILVDEEVFYGLKLGDPESTKQDSKCKGCGGVERCSCGDTVHEPYSGFDAVA